MSAPVPVRPHITYETLCGMPPDGQRYELFEGEAYMTPSPNLRHQFLVTRLLWAFNVALRGASRVVPAPIDVVLSPDTVVQPDLVVVLENNAAILQDVIRGVPDLVVEVLSPSTAARDRALKFETYARHGVSEYWIVDDDVPCVEIYRLAPGSSAYGQPGLGDEVTSPLLPSLALDVTNLFED